MLLLLQLRYVLFIERVLFDLVGKDRLTRLWSWLADTIMAYTSGSENVIRNICVETVHVYDHLKSCNL